MARLDTSNLATDEFTPQNPSAGTGVSGDSGFNKKNQGKNQPFIVDLVNLEKLFFQNIPANLEYEPNTTLVSLPAFGRNLSNYQYTGAEDVLKFELSFYGDISTRDDVLRKCKWLEALSKDDGVGGGLHLVQLCFGDMFKDSKWFMKSATYNLALFNRKFGMLPQLATIKLTLVKVNDDNPTRDNILKIST